MTDPFFALEYLVPGWFFQFFDAVVKDLFLALLLIFWLLCIEEFRDGDDFDANSKKHATKVFVAAAYFVFAVITFTWASVADRRNPVLSSPFEIPAVVVLYVITVLILFGAIVWMVIMAVMAIPKIAHSPLMFTRFLFLAIPSFVLALVVLIGAFCGNYGTGNTNSFQLVFFSTLYNVYTWLLVFGFWPAPGRYDRLCFFFSHLCSCVFFSFHVLHALCVFPLHSWKCQDHRGGQRRVSSDHR